MLGEQEEFAAEIVERWVETHKKSMTTLAILVALGSRPMWSKELEQWLAETTGWELTERGLHRILQRMTALGVICYETTNSPKSGADRKVYEITEFGSAIASSIKDDGLAYLRNDTFTKLLARV